MPVRRTIPAAVTPPPVREPRPSASHSRAGAWPRGAAPPVLVEVRRGGVSESRHRGHVVQVGADGAIERVIGDPQVLVSLRSAAKPLGLVAFVEFGAADAYALSAPELAVLGASHSGEDLHVRTIQAILRRAGISQSLLGCGTANAPLDGPTAQRLARDGERPGPIRHQCSGQHASFLLLAKYAGWPLEEYWEPEHPTQVAFRDALARVLRLPATSLVTSVDACGIPNYHVPLVEVARAYALLADPPGVASDARTRSLVPALTRIRDAMLAEPDLVAGRDRLDTALMRAIPGRVVAKGGAEALEGVSLLPGVLPGHATAAGLAVKIDDGDGAGRARPAVTVEALRQIGVLDEEALRRLAAHHRPPLLDPRGVVVGEVVASFELAPLSELR